MVLRADGQAARVLREDSLHSEGVELPDIATCRRRDVQTPEVVTSVWASRASRLRVDGVREVRVDFDPRRRYRSQDAVDEVRERVGGRLE